MLTVDFARSETPTTCSFGVTSEVGLLRRVLIHTPGAELDHLQPGNALDMLFDDSPAPARAADEHRAFEALLHESGVDAVQVKVALQAALASAAARHAVIRAIEAGHATMPGSVDMALRELLSYASPAQLADLLIHGVTMRQLDIADVSDWIDPNEFALRPLPNQVFTRDSSFVVGDTICLPSMAKSARTGEALVIEAVYRALQAVDPIESCDHPKRRHVFIALFDRTGHTYEEDAQYFWQVLQWLHEHDPQPWPAGIPSSTDSPEWEFCFAGDPMFAFPCIPAYQHRRSRRMGEHFLMCFQPRRIFFGVDRGDPGGERIREDIYARVEDWDAVPPHPQLVDLAYDDPTMREWRQYALPDQNTRLLEQCPLHTNGKVPR